MVSMIVVPEKEWINSRDVSSLEQCHNHVKYSQYEAQKPVMIYIAVVIIYCRHVLIKHKKAFHKQGDTFVAIADVNLFTSR